MKKMVYQNVKGTQDYLPDAELVRKHIKRTLEDVFITYGCQPLETSIVNYTELLASKYAGGVEIIEEMYTLTDRGKRDLALRYDLTIPFAKVVAMNRSLRMPFKRYEIGKVFRDGPIKTGRLREFTQCDVDIVGVDTQVAEAELMAMALDAFGRLDLDVEIHYNNRKLLTGLLELFGVKREKINRAVLTIDKVEKIGVNGVIRELGTNGVEASALTLIQGFLEDNTNTDFSYYEPYATQSDQVAEGLAELVELMSYLSFLGLDQDCVFSPSLARGLDIYTGTIYEIFLRDDIVTSSIGSGGRYDNAIGGMIGTDEAFATVGISFGLDVIYTAVKLSGRIITEQTAIDYYIVPLNAHKEALVLAQYIRSKGYKVEVEMGNKRVRKAFEQADREGVLNVIVLGENEVESNRYTVRNMETGDETIETFTFV